MRTPVDPIRLNRRRLEKGLSQTALAEAIGVSKQLVSAVCLGKANFSPEKLAKAAEVLGCEVEDLLPVDEARSRIKQLVDLVSLGAVSFGPADLSKVAEVLGCEVVDLSAEDLAAVAEVLGCEVADLLPDHDEQSDALAQRPAV
ncbi:helix-turn-helix transcriptional regulator [Streptomyces sp. NPDC014802]|uniref:helix-turn-helix transcriptional regulator n=1 Tax=Streptomyces sp. NPDC014802 TaxID=3364917 RepID=UPI0036F8FDFF